MTIIYLRTQTDGNRWCAIRAPAYFQTFGSPFRKIVAGEPWSTQGLTAADIVFLVAAMRCWLISLRRSFRSVRAWHWRCLADHSFGLVLLDRFKTSFSGLISWCELQLSVFAVARCICQLPLSSSRWWTGTGRDLGRFHIQHFEIWGGRLHNCSVKSRKADKRARCVPQKKHFFVPKNV